MSLSKAKWFTIASPYQDSHIHSSNTAMYIGCRVGTWQQAIPSEGQDSTNPHMEQDSHSTAIEQQSKRRKDSENKEE